MTPTPASILLSRASKIRHHLESGTEPRDKELLDACETIAICIVGLQDAEFNKTGQGVHPDIARPICAFLIDLTGSLRLKVTSIHQHWVAIVKRSLEQGNVREHFAKQNEDFELPLYYIIPSTGLDLFLAPANREYHVCSVCEVPYMSKVNMRRCECSHPKKHSTMRLGMYNVQELEEFWDGLDASTRIGILSESSAIPIPSEENVMAMDGPTFLLSLRELTEHTALFRTNAPPASFAELTYSDEVEEENVLDFEYEAVAADRTLSALLEAFRVHKESAILRLLSKESDEQERKQKKKQKMRLRRLQKNFASRSIMVGITGKWWEEVY